ncbi:hypothetical protein HUU51_03085 [Candidatus Gracilibacteria bacterium]|nr:hypothetical protein [Candidatus Gracilibacteria bacterium]
MYDDIYRLTNVNETNSGTLLESFNYDDVGNRINSFNINTGSGASFDYETNILNQYTTLSGSISSYELQKIIEEIQTGSGTTETITTYTGSLVTTNENTNFVYDNNGNLKNNGTFEFSYDYKNRLTKVETSSGIIAQYSYDVLNRRYLKELENEKVEYIYSNENILSEKVTDLVNQTTTTKNYINGIGLDDLIAYEENNDIYYYHKNHLGSVEGISNSSGNIVVSYEYDSFGNFEITSGTDNGNTRLYTGREYNSEIGLYYLRARYYNSELGRFISRDPIDIADDVNLYSYVGNNSLNYVDLMGTEGKPLTIPQTAAEHYARNVLNVDLPETEIDAIKNGWRLLSQSESVWHSYNTPTFEFNTKYISKDGHREAVYHYKTGKLVLEAENMGTYNYYDPITESDLHKEYDVKPYFDYGNSENDKTSKLERITMTAKVAPAYINEKESLLKNKVNSFNRIDFINSFINYSKY